LVREGGGVGAGGRGVGGTACLINCGAALLLHRIVQYAQLLENLLPLKPLSIQLWQRARDLAYALQPGEHILQLRAHAAP
jgi:hypothetical protein